MNSAESETDDETNQANNLEAGAQTLDPFAAAPEEDSRDRQQRQAKASHQH